ncbi:MAG: T9SS type A sorting domain-containing protein [Algicola sp.]|nr:T9SS type A sorting domain-containing protein [Algicola sp.]
MKNIYLFIVLFCLNFLCFSQEEVHLFGDWYLNYRTDNEQIIYPPLTSEENYDIVLNFGLLPPTANNPFTIESYGPTTTTFDGKFEVEQGIMKVFNVTENLNNCEHPIEVCSYFSNYNHAILLDPNTSVVLDEFIMNYEILGIEEDATLIITNNSNGNYAVYGRQTLSTEEVSLQNLGIELVHNPVKTQLELSINQSESQLKYNIYSIDGKLVEEAFLRSKSIHIEDLNSGLYFIQFTNDNKQQQTIKFIKQ